LPNTSTNYPTSNARSKRMTNPSETNQPDRTELQQVLESIADLKGEFKDLKSDVETFNEKFDNYQKATQWVVGLAFSLIGSATVITIISSVFRR
jgi:molecular chaperone GrpE (heat shock protein)